MDTRVVDLVESGEYAEQAARLLMEAFKALDKDAWPDLPSAREEVAECRSEGFLCLGLVNIDAQECPGELLGWAGLRPMYDKTWELHPMVMAPRWQAQGLGRKLLAAIEEAGRQRGLLGIVLGTDDETGSTSLSQQPLNGQNLAAEICNIKNLRNHPFEFYQRCGYSIIGVIPDANGPCKPDIWMWKSLAGSNGI
ncbi:MAG: GNAT family N-acetyltransferase [Spirochaetes bacterium]|nr:GNAT family N-acetyltransferase [Spirochaetota bacterium]MBU0956765.1 GNAT family N-acetyltransferase [Spirochaetota bacterium]